MIIHCQRLHCQEEIKEIMELHQDTKTISCKTCEKTFTSSCGFYYHVGVCLKVMANNNNDDEQTLSTKLQTIASIQRTV